jgi:vacuolar-type H+-ATPase subunit E/Vma4
MIPDDLPHQPDEDEPIKHEAGDVLDFIDETVSRITDANVDEHLRKVLDQAGYSHGQHTDGKSQGGMAQHDEQAHELIEQLDPLKAVDHRITPGHVAKRSRDLLDDLGDGAPPALAHYADPQELPGQMECGGQLAGQRQKHDAEQCADLAGLTGSLQAAITDAQLKAKAAADELRRAQEVTAAARQHAERIVIEARAEADTALERAVKMVRDARNQGQRICGEAVTEAEQILSAAGDKADGALQQAAQMVRDARQQSEQILSEAHREAEQIITAAHDRHLCSAITALPDSQAADDPLISEITRIVEAVVRAAFAGSPVVLDGGLPAVHSGRTLAAEEQAVHRGRPGGAATTAPSADGQICTLFAVDIAGFTRPDRDDDIRRHLHEELYDLMRKAFDGSGIPWAECFSEDRGDGILVIVPPDISARGIIDALPDRLASLVRRHNHVSCPAAAFQLRAAAHIGPVSYDGYGLVGSDVNLLFRLLEARPLRRELAASGAELALGVSDYMYRSTVCRYPSLVNADAFRAARVQVKGTRTRAWIYLPGQRPTSPVPGADGAAELRPGPREADSESLASPGTPDQRVPKIGLITAESAKTSTSQLVCDLRR